MLDSNGNSVEWSVKYYPYMLDAIDTYRVIPTISSISVKQFRLPSGRIKVVPSSLIDTIEDAHELGSLPHCAISGCTASAEVGITVECDFQEDVIQIEEEDFLFNEYPTPKPSEFKYAGIPICRPCERTTRDDKFLELEVTECVIFTDLEHLTYDYHEHCGQQFFIDHKDIMNSECVVCRSTLHDFGYHEGDDD